MSSGSKIDMEGGTSNWWDKNDITYDHPGNNTEMTTNGHTFSCNPGGSINIDVPLSSHSSNFVMRQAGRFVATALSAQLYNSRFVGTQGTTFHWSGSGSSRLYNTTVEDELDFMGKTRIGGRVVMAGTKSHLSLLTSDDVIDAWFEGNGSVTVATESSKIHVNSLLRTGSNRIPFGSLVYLHLENQGSTASILSQGQVTFDCGVPPCLIAVLSPSYLELNSSYVLVSQNNTNYNTWNASVECTESRQWHLLFENGQLILQPGSIIFEAVPALSVKFEYTTVEVAFQWTCLPVNNSQCKKNVTTNLNDGGGHSWSSNGTAGVTLRPIADYVKCARYDATAWFSWSSNGTELQGAQSNLTWINIPKPRRPIAMLNKRGNGTIITWKKVACPCGNQSTSSAYQLHLENAVVPLTGENYFLMEDQQALWISITCTYDTLQSVSSTLMGGSDADPSSIGEAQVMTFLYIIIGICGVICVLFFAWQGWKSWKSNQQAKNEERERLVSTVN